MLTHRRLSFVQKPQTTPLCSPHIQLVCMILLEPLYTTWWRGRFQAGPKHQQGDSSAWLGCGWRWCCEHRCVPHLPDMVHEPPTMTYSLQQWDSISWLYRPLWTIPPPLISADFKVVVGAYIQCTYSDDGNVHTGIGCPWPPIQK